MENLDRLLVSSLRDPATYLAASSNRVRNLDIVTIPIRCSTLVYRRYNTVYQGTWSSKRILSGFDRDFRPRLSRKSRRQGARGTNVEAIRTPPGFSWLMEMRVRRIRSERETKSKKSRGRPPPAEGPPVFPPLPPPRAAWDYFSDRQPEATGLIIEAGIEAETEKRFLRSSSYRGEFLLSLFFSSFFFFFRRHFARVGILLHSGFSWVVRV